MVDRFEAHVAERPDELALVSGRLHGLATMGITSRVAAEAVSAHPADLSAATVRFFRPVYPGCRLRIDAETHRTTARVESSVDGTTTMSGTFTY